MGCIIWRQTHWKRSAPQAAIPLVEVREGAGAIARGGLDETTGFHRRSRRNGCVMADLRARQVVQTFDTWAPRMILTSALGDRAGAERERIETQRHQPEFSIEQVRRDYLVFDESCLERLLTGLRKAGVPRLQPREKWERRWSDHVCAKCGAP
jgi:hypothetical protein